CRLAAAGVTWPILVADGPARACRLKRAAILAHVSGDGDADERQGEGMAVTEDAGPVEAADEPRHLDVSQVGPLVFALVILALCAFFHLWRLDATPGWDPQEGYNLDIAWNLLHGHPRIFALPTAFAQHPPLFYLQLA